MNLNDWQQMSQEQQQWEFYFAAKTKDVWDEKTQEILGTIKRNREHYERNVLGIPQAFIDMDRGELNEI